MVEPQRGLHIPSMEAVRHGDNRHLRPHPQIEVDAAVVGTLDLAVAAARVVPNRPRDVAFICLLHRVSGSRTADSRLS